ncbi:hypothetical protein ACJ2CR_23570 [Myxococcus faecalis]|uniref:hypothetical protein n=2 Tax=Myxococcaceae TaxID=31 RepID=UPI0020BE2B58|nr:hypothetical protein [Myxococcus fulvus]MCK8498888.1 hypothetical protein [Myxococcus fulvus]
MRHPSWGTVVVFMLTGSVLTACGGLEESAAPQPIEEPATAEQGLVTLVSCPIGSTVLNYSPPLKNTSQAVTTTGTTTYSNCYSLFGGVTSGNTPLNVFRPSFACSDLLDIGTTNSVVTWNTLETSTLTLTRLGARVEGLSVVFTHVGSVVSGKFEGATAIRTTTVLNTDLDACSSPEGLARHSGTATLSLLGLL